MHVSDKKKYKHKKKIDIKNICVIFFSHINGILRNFVLKEKLCRLVIEVSEVQIKKSLCLNKCVYKNSTI